MLAEIGILVITQVVPDQETGVELVVKDAGAALPVAVDCALRPASTARPWYAVAVQLVGDPTGRLAVAIALEDPYDDGGVNRIDHPATPFLSTDFVAVAQPAGGRAYLDAPAQAAPGLLGEVNEE